MAFITATTLAAGLGVWVYFRLGSPLRRVLALVGGIGQMTLFSAANFQTRDYRVYYGLPQSARDGNPLGVVFIVVLDLLMLTVGLLAYWRQHRRSRLA
jgi:hypothetical protein